jgi:hypothetical protein
MRSTRMLLGIVGLLTVLGAGGCGPAIAAATARNNAGVWVEVTPATIQAGAKVAIKASCGDNSNSATVTSPAFGTLTVQPWNSLLFAEIDLPVTAPAGTHQVTVNCRTGASANTTLTVLGGAPGTVGPHTGGGFLAHSQETSTRRPVTWLVAGLGALLLAAAVRTVTIRRRRRLAGR